MARGPDERGERDTLRALFEQTIVAIAVLEGSRHTFTFANAAYLAIVGNEHIVGKPLLEALPELRGQGFDTLLDEVMATGKPFIGRELPVKLAHHGPDECLYLNVSYEAKRSAAGEIDGVLVTTFDVTEQVLARRALEHNEERLRRLVEATGAGTWEVFLATGTLIADSELRRLHVYPPDGAFDLETGFAAIHEDDKPRVQAAVQAALSGANEGRYHAEYRVVHPDGRIRWIEARGLATFDASGVATRFVGTGIDVTERVEARETLLASEARLHEIFQNAPAAICLLAGPNHRFVIGNPRYRELVGGRDIVGKSIAEALPEVVAQGFVELLDGVRRTGIPHIGTETWLDLQRAGSGPPDRVCLNFIYQPIRMQDGDTYIFVHATDVTDLVRAREEAVRLSAERQVRVEFERQLIGIVSHDLRNPLNVLKMGIHLLGDSEIAPANAEANLKVVARMRSAVDRGISMVSDLLDFTQVRLGGGLSVVRSPGDLNVVLQGVVDQVSMTVPERTVKLVASGDARGEWDDNRLAQVIQNLLVNALQYSPPGTPVEVQSRATQARVTITVRNDGPPIPEAALARIFEPMQRGSATTNGSGRSVGLGLFIVKHLVEAHGGTLTATSTEQDGTEFSFSVPKRVIAT